MSRFRPVTFDEAVKNRSESPQKPRKPMSRGTKGLNRRSLSHNRPETGVSGKPATFLKRGPVARGKPKSASRKGKRKKKTDGQLKKLAWREFSIFIRTRHADPEGMVLCVTCPTKAHWKTMQAGHFLRGRLNANLFDERGCFAQCYACNCGRDGNVVEYYVWMLANQGQAVIDELRAKNNVTHKWEPGELQGLLDHYRELNRTNPLVQESK